MKNRDNYLRNLQSFIKNILIRYWKVVAIALLSFFVGFIIYFKFLQLSNQQTDLRAKLIDNRNLYMRDMERLHSIFERQRLEQERIDNEFNRRIEELTKNYQEHMTKLSRERRERQRYFENNPSQLSDIYQTIFGIPSR